MSLFQCEKCGCCENTALTSYHSAHTKIWPEEYRGKKLCSACASPKYADGTKTKYGEWHNVFPRVYLPQGEFKTNQEGNLEHIETGSTDFRKFSL